MMMKITEILLLKPLSFFILFRVSLIQTIVAHDCRPSSCGIIRDISPPFRLKDDPKHCGYPDYELECENNVTLVHLNSHRYRVKAINYNNFTIRLVDYSIDSSNVCSFPTYSAYRHNFSLSGYHPYSTWRNGHYSRVNDETALPINLMSCPHPLNNSFLFTELPAYCASNTSRAAYINPGHMTASDVPYTCRIDLIVMTSWNFTDISLSHIHNSLLYGFELSWFMYPCSKCTKISYCYVGIDHFATCDVPKDVMIITATFIIVVVLLGVTNMPFAIIITIQYICLSRLRYFELDFWGSSFSPDGNFPRHLLTELLLKAGTFFALKNFILFPCAVGFMIRKFRRRRLSMYDAIEDFLRSDNKLLPVRYSYSDIKKMTRGFQQKLGQGGYGMVYKGRLQSGHHVAVKLLGKLRANDQDFMNEIATIGRIHHVNVVKLVGYCAERAKRAIVYDFMPNGSLDKYIFSEGKTNCLNWEMKYKIAVGVARGIEYLHRGCDIQILHFDIKPHNILLDDNFIPKISDFGLAKFCSTDKNTVSMTAARGTIGYVAPELINRGFGIVSYKADVYSFGMLLIEMVGLKRDLKGNNKNSSQYFPDWIYGCLDQGKDVEFGKPNEEIDEDEEGARKFGRKMTIVALWCIQMRPEDRPSMNKVMEMLEAEIEQLQIPKCPAQSSQVVIDMDQSLSTFTTDSIPLLHHDAEAPTFEITVEES